MNNDASPAPAPHYTIRVDAGKLGKLDQPRQTWVEAINLFEAEKSAAKFVSVLQPYPIIVVTLIHHTVAYPEGRITMQRSY